MAAFVKYEIFSENLSGASISVTDTNTFTVDTGAGAGDQLFTVA